MVIVQEGVLSNSSLAKVGLTPPAKLGSEGGEWGRHYLLLVLAEVAAEGNRRVEEVGDK